MTDDKHSLEMLELRPECVLSTRRGASAGWALPDASSGNREAGILSSGLLIRANSFGKGPTAGLVELEFKPRFRGSTRLPGVNGRCQTPGVTEKRGFDVMLMCLLGTLEHLQRFAMKDEFVLFGFFIPNRLWTNTSMRYSKNEFSRKAVIRRFLRSAKMPQQR